MNLDYEAWRCPSRDTFDGTGGDSVFCPTEGCTKEDGCARDRGWTPGRRCPAHLLTEPCPTCAAYIAAGL